MLTLENVTYTIPGDGGDTALLDQVSLEVPAGHFMAIVGPSGCGKTTLLKIIAGLLLETSGRILWRGRDVTEDGEISPQELGYVPQFSIAHDPLMVEECVENAVRLRTRLSGEKLYLAADEAIVSVGLEPLREQRVAVLSGGQKRRLGLAMELVSHPALLLCDEVTSGLDPRSGDEIVSLLHSLSRRDHRTVVNVTHSLSGLELYDSVLVLVAGRVAYHGPPASLAHYFSVPSVEDVYPRLELRQPAEWHESWQKRRSFYYGQMADAAAFAAAAKKLKAEGESTTDPAALAAAPAPPTPPSPAFSAPAARPADAGAGDKALPGALRQFLVLFSRRWTLFFRDRTQLLLQLALLFGFPLLVIIFAHNGIGSLPESAGHGDLSELEKMEIQARALQGQARLGGLISGLVMFQVVLLTLMGSNNASREIAGERLIYEKERLGGVRPLAYLGSKAAFLGILVIVQSCWMALFVNFFAHLPGELTDRLLLLLMANGAMTMVCLAISSLMKSAEQASLLSIYLVGFQLPLSGAVLALPPAMEKIIQPLIAAYWSWSGQLAAMRPTDYFVAINRAVPTPVVSDPSLPLTVLGLHMAAGLVFAWLGCLRHQWD
ncbi:MAG: ATP-binding cassette domain-containing protein [Verrucomicrobiota bacterium]